MNEPGKIVYTNGTYDIIPLEPPPVPIYITEYFERIDRNLMEASGLHPVLIGDNIANT